MLRQSTTVLKLAQNSRISRRSSISIRLGNLHRGCIMRGWSLDDIESTTSRSRPNVLPRHLNGLLRSTLNCSAASPLLHLTRDGVCGPVSSSSLYTYTVTLEISHQFCESHCTTTVTQPPLCILSFTPLCSREQRHIHGHRPVS